MVGFFDPRTLGCRWSLLLFLGLAGAIAPHVVKFWDHARTMADSEFYVKNSARPPLYPWFIQAVNGDAAWSADDFRAAGMPLPAPGSAILRVVRAQRVVLWTAFLFAAWAASLLVTRPLAVLLFSALHLNDMLLPDLESSLMSEPLALAFLFVVVAAFCLVAARHLLWPLPVLAGAYGCLVLTRSAGVFAVAFLAVAVVVAAIANWQRKRALAGALTATGLVGLLALGGLLGNSYARSGVWTLSPLQNWERVAFAVQVADPSDLDATPDPDARQFLDEALRQRIAKKSRAPVEDFDLNLNCWEIAYPLAQGMFVARFGKADLPEPGEYTPALYGYVNGLFGRVADVVLARHRKRYLRIVAHSFFTRAARDYTRLRWGRVSFLWLAALGFIGCLIGRNTCALAGATCLAAHLGNLVVMSCFELPMQRYVYFSEWVCLLGLLLAGIGCGERVAGKVKSWRSWSEPVIEGIA